MKKMTTTLLMAALPLNALAHHEAVNSGMGATQIVFLGALVLAGVYLSKALRDRTQKPVCVKTEQEKK